MVLERSTDSDGGIWYTLVQKGSYRSIRLDRQMNGWGPLEALGDFIRVRGRHPFLKWSDTGSP